MINKNDKKRGKLLAIVGLLNGLFLIGISALAFYYKLFAITPPYNYIMKIMIFTLSAIYTHPFTWEDFQLGRNYLLIRILLCLAGGIVFLIGSYFIHRVLIKDEHRL